VQYKKKLSKNPSYPITTFLILKGSDSKEQLQLALGQGHISLLKEESY